MKLNFVLLITFFFSFVAFSQENNFNSGVVLNSGFSVKDEMPFWATANKYGAIPNSNYGSLNAYIENGFQKLTSNWDFAYKGSFSGYLAEENLAFINELYGSVRFKGIKLTIGNRYDAEKWEGLSSSNGNFLKSVNARAMPGVNLETNGYVPLFFWKDWFSVKANYGEYLMNDDRFVDGAHAHHKSLHLKFKTSENFSFSLGLDDWAQWGGTSPRHGEQPTDFNSYIRMVFGMPGGDNAFEGDQINALGNHMGNYLIELNHLGNKLNWNFYWSHPFEDGSGREMQNWPDALYGVFIDFKKTKSLVSHLVFETTYTKNVSGSSPHYIDEDGNEVPARGRDQYFKNGIYASGWSYFGKTIGTPYIITEIGDDGLPTGPDLSYNRFLAFNIGTKGYLKKVSYSTMISYVRYFAWFDEEFESTPRQFSGFAEFDISQVLNWQFNVELGASFDISNRLPDNFGAFIRLYKNFTF